MDPRYALNISIASTGSIWILLVAGAACGASAGIGYTLLALTMSSTMMLYWRYRGIFW
ncbi:MAG TPA: hypothetical protein V6C82_03120 [Chroococcales cyanobacterium]|jgi:uncharacterized membrane protein YoaK (UPF0700 family)